MDTTNTTDATVATVTTDTTDTTDATDTITEYKKIYSDMTSSNYSFNEIRLFFLIKYNVDISSNDEFASISVDRIGQDEFRNKLIKRFKGRCILTGALSRFEACHIISYADSQNMHVDNGLLLYNSYHKLFDDYVWSINPNTLFVEVNYNLIDSNDEHVIEELQRIENKHISQLNSYPKTIKYLEKHYIKHSQIRNYE